MVRLPRHAQRAAQWVVDSVMGNKLSQEQTEGAGTRDVTPGMPELARRAAAEGCVLLKNDGALPLRTDDEVAVFGRCQLDWFSMGRGSGGDVNPPYTTNLIDGLVAVNARYNRVLAETYRAWCASDNHRAEQGFWSHWPQHHPEMPVSAELAEAAAVTARTALVVIGRAAGEDQDLKLAPGGFYLTDEESELLRVVTGAFERTVVVLNTTNVIDLAWTEDSEVGSGVSAVLLAWTGGMEAGRAVADVLYGRVNPSGCLAQTVARRYEDHPSSASFGRPGAVAYDEGVYVGYRHFDTNHPEQVLYPFGHGLSYTSFEIEPGGVGRDGDKVRVEASVRNTGDADGRKVVLLWCELPHGRIDKPKRVLAAFEKTGTLAPAQTEALSFAFDLAGVASFDEGRRAFVLEQGRYRLFANDVLVGSIDLAQEVVFPSLERACMPDVDLRSRILERMPEEVAPTGDAGIRLEDVAEGRAAMDAFVAQLSDEELETLTRGEGAMNSALGTPGNAGAFGGTLASLREKGVPPIICADGPSGARLRRYCSLIPCATALACTWDVELVRELSALVGAEVQAAGVDVLLAPGMNIQRDPLCGRNFEYFSEDPLVSGRMAAAVVRGLRDAGTLACPKHLACNNQERGRNTSDSIVSERALREIYLRGFEICVREARPEVVMTSYNKVNGVWSHYNYDLAITVLRGEWGFAGVVITDWWMRRAKSPEFPRLRDNAYRVRAGVDVLMPGNMGHLSHGRQRDRTLRETLGKPDGITRAELQRTARAVLSLSAKVREMHDRR